MRRQLCAALVFVAAPWLVGCGGPNVREGIWQLSWTAQEADSGTPWEIPERLVRVRVGPDRTAEGQIAEITPLPAEAPAGTEEPSEADEPSGAGERAAEDPTRQLRPMYADIRVRKEGDPPTAQIQTSDAYWRLIMWGRVVSPTLIEGYRFGARLRRSDHPLVLEGWWTLRWIRDE